MSPVLRFLLLLSLLSVGGLFRAPVTIAASTGTSAADSIEIGQIGTVGDYALTVAGFDPNATETLTGGDEGTPPPPEGSAYVMATFDATNNGAEASSPAFSFTFEVVGPSARGIMSHYLDCGTIPNDGFAVENVNPGETVTFSLCWVVPERDREGLILYVDPLLGTGEGIVWFSLGNAAPTFTAPAVPEGAVVANSEADPAAIGTTGQTDPYLISVTGANLDATEQVLEMDAFNEEPEDGNRFVLATIAITYLGDGVGDPGVDLAFTGVGASGTEYTPASDSCGIVVNDEHSTGDLFPGAVVSANVCWQVAADDAGTLLLRVASYGESSGEPVWFALQS
jgi:hypothetical protein